MEPNAGTSFTVCKLFACLMVLAATAPALAAPSAIDEARECRDRGIAEIRSKQVPMLPDPRGLGAIHEIALPSIVATVRSASGQVYRRKTWFTLYLPSYEAVDVAWERMPALRTVIATGLADSRFEDTCTIAEDQALTFRLQERVRRVLDDDRAILRTAISGAERVD
jgi:cellulose synthase/poly-beta-1,6-N-acetylglucosamine synthase-like glycosyltransferase